MSKSGSCVIVKIGSALITDGGRGLNRDAIAGWAQQIVAARQQGYSVIVVSSGAVAEGMARMGWTRRPESLDALQAAAAIGQMGVAQAWSEAFAVHATRTAQILLTHDDVADRQRYLNARSTLLALVKLGVVPIVNENDSVATDEIRLGDNDRLGAVTANLVDAQGLVILTDQPGLLDADPTRNPDAQLIRTGTAGDPALARYAGAGAGALGRGGMVTKLQAAALAASGGSWTVIADGRRDHVLSAALAGEPVGTRLEPAGAVLGARKRWIAGRLHPAGTIEIDAGAVRALREAGRSLLPVGVSAVRGAFQRGDVVSCVGPDGQAVATGLTNYSSDEARRLVGCATDAMVDVLGYVGDAELIHRDNLALRT